MLFEQFKMLNLYWKESIVTSVTNRKYIARKQDYIIRDSTHQEQPTDRRGRSLITNAFATLLTSHPHKLVHLLEDRFLQTYIHSLSILLVFFRSSFFCNDLRFRKSLFAKNQTFHIHLVHATSRKNRAMTNCQFSILGKR